MFWTADVDWSAGYIPGVCQKSDESWSKEGALREATNIRTPSSAASLGKLLGSDADVQMGKLAEHLAVFKVQAFHETGVIQSGLTLRFAQIAKLVQALHDRLTARRRQLLPARKQCLLDFAPLVGSHLLPNSLAFAEFLLLCRSQFIPCLETLANSRLLVSGQISEAFVILKKLFLLVRGHLAEVLESPGRQVVHVPRVPSRTHDRAVRRVARPAGRLCLADLADLLTEGGRTEQTRC